MNPIVSLNGVSITQPSDIQYDEINVHDEDSGRFASGLAYVAIIASKRTLTLTWNVLRPAQAQAILQAVKNDTYFTCEYYEPDLGNYTTRTFYLGDRSVSFLQWFNGGEAFGSLSFQLIER